MDDEHNFMSLIDSVPHEGPGEARLREYGVHVWALAGYLQAVKGNIEEVAHDYDLPLVAVEAALAYYQQHKTAIDARIAANLAPDEHQPIARSAV